jgi:hypothetical protein
MLLRSHRRPGAISVTEVTDDEQNGDDEESIQSTDATVQDGIKEKEGNEPPTQVHFQDQPNMIGVSIERDGPLDDDRDELYRLHVRTGHLSFSKLRAMARRGALYVAPASMAKQPGSLGVPSGRT